MGGREKSLENKAKDGVNAFDSQANAAIDKTKAGAADLANRAQDLGNQAKAKVEQVTK